MIDQSLYQAIFKRKSFHRFANVETDRISPEVIQEIEEACRHFSPLCPDIKTAVRIVPEEETTCRRKPAEEIWAGEHMKGITDIARFAPSACNTQPWIVEHSRNTLKVYRYKKEGKRGIMPAARKNPV